MCLGPWDLATLRLHIDTVVNPSEDDNADAGRDDGMCFFRHIDDVMRPGGENTARTTAPVLLAIVTKDIPAPEPTLHAINPLRLDHLLPVAMASPLAFQ